jgi:hypothetical protein
MAARPAKAKRPVVKPPPKVKLRTNEPLQEWFQDVDGHRYAVARLLDDTKDLPVFEATLASFDLTDQIWKGCDLRALALHVRKCMQADLNYPILIAWDGSIADGRHRLLKAIAMGKRTILARRMYWRPEPDKEAPP